MESNYLAERKQLESLYKRRKVDVVYSQQPIQPLKSTYSPSEQLNIVLQNSKHMIDIGKIQLFYRPVIKYNYSQTSAAEAAKWALLGITPIDSENCIFTIQSVTFNGNQLLSQPQTSLQRTRSIWQAYYNNFMSNKEKNTVHGRYTPSNYTFGSDSGSQKTAFVETGIVQPYAAQSANGPFPTSRIEGTNYPRAIMSRLIQYNADFNIAQAAAAATLASNEYFGQVCSNNADSVLTSAAINAMIPGADNNNVFPLLPLSVTPSTSVYKSQQDRFLDVRMRFLVSCVTPFSQPICSGGTISYNQAYLNLVGGAAVNAYSTTMAVNQNYTLNQAAYAQANQALFGAQQKVLYGMSIQDQTPNSTARATGVYPSATNCTYVQNEQFTELSCELGAICMELQQIGMVPMDSTQVLVQLQLNQPYNVLSAFLPTGNLYATGNFTANNQVTPVTVAQVNEYLAGCQLANKATYFITDVCTRIEYFTYPDESYSLIRELLRQPKPYQSIRQQIDNIPSANIFTQRLSIGASSIINALVLFIVPQQKLNQSLAINGNAANGRPQDTVINLQGCQPLMQGDLRSTYIDSYYITMSSVYAEVDGRRFEALDIPLSNPELSTYLKTQAGLQTALGKYIDLDLREYLQNRFFYVIPINPHNDASMMVHDQQIVITCNFNQDSRVQSSTLWNESIKSIANQFQLLTFAITHQALVDASYIKVL